MDNLGKLYEKLTDEMHYAIEMGDVQRNGSKLQSFYHGKEHGIEIAMKLIRKEV